MGCYKSKCKLCKEEILSESLFSSEIKTSGHLKNKHPKVHKQNKFAHLQYQEDMQVALDKKLKNSHTPCFTSPEWDPEDYAE